MKTAKEILQNKIGKNVVFRMDGDIIISGSLNANDIVAAMQSYASQSAGQGSEGVKWRLVKDGNIPTEQYLICGNDDDIFVDMMYEYYPQTGFVGYGQLSANHNITRYVPISSLQPLPVSPSKPMSEVLPPTDNDIRLAAEKYLSEFALDYPPGNATCFAAGVKWALQQIKNQNG